MRALVSLYDNCGNNPGWYKWSWSTETVATSLLSVSFLMYPYFFRFVIHFHLLSVPNMHYSQRWTSSFRSINSYGITPSFASINIYLGCRWYKIPCQDLNSCCDSDSTYVNITLSIFLMWYSLNRWYNTLSKFELIQYLAHYLSWGTTYLLILCFCSRTPCCTLCYQYQWCFYPPDLTSHFVTY